MGKNKRHNKPCACDVCEKARWEYSCSDGSHPSFWKTVITSSQWKVWQTEQRRRFDLLQKYQSCNSGIYDMSEVEECGWISQEHFQEFIKFIQGKKYAEVEQAEICSNGKNVK